MDALKVCFLTTNTIWGGSEVLWTAALKHFNELDIDVIAAAAYNYEHIKFTGIPVSSFCNLENRFQSPSLTKRILSKLRIIKSQIPEDKLLNWLKINAPDLVVISQGNNVEGYEYMRLCKFLNINYVTLTHLAIESVWPSLDDQKMNELIELYNNSKKNYFVSSFVKSMHDRILASKCTNFEIISNPFLKNLPESIVYPSFNVQIFKVAMIGRIEAYHKGLDILLEVFKQQKWKDRNIQVSIFGSGPHKTWFKRSIENNKITNIFLQSHVEAIECIWNEHQLLLMPSRMEGQSLTLLESMKFNRSCVVTPVGGVDELVIDGKTGFVAKNITAASFDEAMERAWAERMNWEQMGIAAGKQFELKIPEHPVQEFCNKIIKLAKASH